MNFDEVLQFWSLEEGEPLCFSVLPILVKHPPPKKGKRALLGDLVARPRGFLFGWP